LLEKVASHSSINYSDIERDGDLILDIIDMIERRRLYFYVYHKGMQLGELNEASLWAFWILKFCPFRDKTRTRNSINIIIALNLFLHSTWEYAKAKNKGFIITLDKIKYLEHAFKFRDLSKEALMAIAESLIV
jgi:hypothetical protein